MDRFKTTYKYQLSAAGHLPHAALYGRGRSCCLSAEQPSSSTASEGPKSESLFPLKVVTSGPLPPNMSAEKGQHQTECKNLFLQFFPRIPACGTVLLSASAPQRKLDLCHHTDWTPVSQLCTHGQSGSKQHLLCIKTREIRLLPSVCFPLWAGMTPSQTSEHSKHAPLSSGLSQSRLSVVFGEKTKPLSRRIQLCYLF